MSAAFERVPVGQLTLFSLICLSDTIIHDSIPRMVTKNQINYKYEQETENVKPGEIIVTIGGFSSGFENYDLKLIVINLQNNFEEPVKRKKKLSSTFKDSEKIVFADLKPGDIVVHQTHGIGQFIGVNTITADGVTKDYIKIKYKDDGILYVPTSNPDNVKKYIEF